MITTARQLKDLIRNMSKKKSADAQILMRNYMMERFLERISLSEYKNQFILKGGMLVAAMVGLDARATMDLDATIKGTNVSVEDVEMIISQIISIPLVRLDLIPEHGVHTAAVGLRQAQVVVSRLTHGPFAAAGRTGCNAALLGNLSLFALRSFIERNEVLFIRHVTTSLVVRVQKSRHS